MEKPSLVCLFLVFSFTLQHSYRTVATTTTTSCDQRLETWGYVEVLNSEDPSAIWPIILWLQGGPGGSGVAIGNFLDIGPLDQHLKARQYTWLRKADLLFVDSPVETGFSYVDDDTLLATSDEEAATELLFLLKNLFNRFEFLQKSTLFIFGESYGGKITVTLGLAIVKAIHDKELTLTLGGNIYTNSLNYYQA
ncbi:serine carboxypeptidase-like 51 [Tripterygium wilfordii]|uniref:serine carboxypeptidase-like 51 n=1 Tax=Tripterygium wilfordii TaxID=458696 RepID=UPI0018F807E1|nr:serine carboxypeptidase-like 51 [Tripterygium wilfordii]